MQHRIAAGGVVIDGDRLLLVRYANNSGGSYLVCPGGRVDGDESMIDAVHREVMEETGLEVRASRLLMIEDIIARRFRMKKSWFLCSVIGGAVQPTQGAADEGIIEAGWFRRGELNSETVFPSIVKCYDWEEFRLDAWQAVFEGTRRDDF